MISSEKNSAGPTSLPASMIACARPRAPSSPGGSRSRCLCAFSIITIAASIIAPMAMAMPPRLMMFELMPSQRMQMKAISTPTGSMMMATSALLTCSRNTTQTAATISDSSSSVVVSVRIARWIRSERSYTASIDTPSGSPGFSSSMRFLMLSITRSAFSPNRATAMPETTSPSPFSSAIPRRSSGPSSTRATSRTRTGVPCSARSTSASMSAAPRR